MTDLAALTAEELADHVHEAMFYDARGKSLHLAELVRRASERDPRLRLDNAALCAERDKLRRDLSMYERSNFKNRMRAETAEAERDQAVRKQREGLKRESHYRNERDQAVRERDEWKAAFKSLPSGDAVYDGEAWREAYIARMLETKQERERADRLAAALEPGRRFLAIFGSIMADESDGTYRLYSDAALHNAAVAFRDALAASQEQT